MRVLITGGAGRLGRYCLQDLREHGHQVTLFDRVRPEVVPQPWSPDAPVVVGDLLSATDCLRAAELAQAEAIVHLGGITHPSEVPYVQGRPLEARAPMHETFPINVMGTYWVMEAARQVGARVVAFASTMSTLGISPRLGALPIPVHTMPVDETHPFWAENTYSLSKVIDEEILRAFGRAYGIRSVALRMMAVVFAQGERAVMPATPAMQPDARSRQGTAGRLGQPAQAAPAGNFVVWEYVNSRDAASAYRLAIEADQLDLFEPFFIATDRTSVEAHRDLAMRQYPHLREQAAQMGPDDLILTIRRARERLGYAPVHSWRGSEANARVR